MSAGVAAWPRVRLGEVVRQRKEFITLDERQLYKRPRVQLHARGIALRDEVPGTLIKTKSQQVCRAGEFLVAEIDAKMGGFGLVPESLAGAIVSSHYFLFVVDETRLAKRFLDWFIRTPAFGDQVIAQGTTNYAAIRPADVLGYEIPLPPVPEQQRIVARIDDFAAHVANALTLVAQTAEEAEVLWWNTLARPFAGASTVGIQLGSACEKIVDNLHTTPRYDGDAFACVRSQDIGWGTLNLATALRTSEEEFTERTRRAEPKVGDIVFVREGDVGRCATVIQPLRFSLGQRVMMFRPADGVDPKLLAYQLMSRPVLDDQIRKAKTGTTSHHVNIKHLRQVRVLVPPPKQQARIVAELDAFKVEVDGLKKIQTLTRVQLDALLPAILDRAFAGAL